MLSSAPVEAVPSGEETHARLSLRQGRFFTTALLKHLLPWVLNTSRSSLLTGDG